jgi:hypothetical protein
LPHNVVDQKKFYGNEATSREAGRRNPDISGILLDEALEIPNPNHFFADVSFGIVNTNHLSEHLMPANDRIQKSRRGNIGLGFLHFIGRGMKL